MDANLGQLERLTPLLQWLESRRPVAPSELTRVLRELATQLVALHEQGQLHGRLTPAMVMIGADGSARLVSQPVGASAIELAGELCPPELRDRSPLTVPSELAAASGALATGRHAFDARRIDVFQLGALLVNAVTGVSLDEYLSRPLASAPIPKQLRPLLDRALGFSSSGRLTDCSQLLSELAQVADPSLPAARETPSRGVAVGDSDTDHPQAKSSARSSQRDASDLPFDRLGPYDVVARLGSGGMGDVYKGYDPDLNRHVAIKVLPSELARHEDFVTRFRAEAAAAAKVEHPNIVPIYTIGCDQGRHFFAMQFIAGESLAQRLAREPRPPHDQVLATIEQVVEGLAAAHRHGLVHRDIKPGNILIDERNGRALLADFGLVKSAENEARITATGMIMGTVDYISPEQGRGKAVDGRSDLYSIGVLLYQTLAGRLPFVADSPTAMIFQHAYESPPPLADVVPEVSADLAAVVHRLMAKSPDDRYQTCDELLLDLRAIRTGDAPAVAARPPKTAVIRAPQLDEPLTQELSVPAVSTALWANWYNRALVWLGRQSPEALRHLQNTQQQVDGAVLEYELRCQSLARLVREAEQVQQLLARQRDAHVQAAADAQRQTDTAGDDESLRRATAQRISNQEAAEQLSRQVDEQRDELESMRLGLAKANARLAGLKGQRDALNARLKIAQAGYNLAEARPRFSRLPTAVGVAAAAVAIVGVVFGVWVFLGNRPNVTSSSPGLGKTDGGKSDVPQLGARIPMTLDSGPSGREATLPVTVNTLHFTGGEAGFDRMVAAGDDGSLMFFDLKEGVFFSESARRQLVHNGPVHSLAWNPVTQRLASGSKDGEIIIWERPSNRLLRRFTQGDDVRDVAFSIDGSQLLSAGEGGVRCWDVASGSELERFADNPISNWTESVAWLPNGSAFVQGLKVSGAPSPYLAGFDHSRPRQLLGVSDRVAYMDTLNGGYEILGAGQSVYVWKAGDGALERSFGSDVQSVAYSQRRLHALIGHSDGSLTLWDTHSGQRVQDVGRLPGKVRAVAISADSRFGAAVDGKVLRIFTLRPERMPHLRIQYQSPAPISSIALSPTEFLAVAASDQQVRMWPLADSGLANVELEGAAPAAVVTMSDDGARILLARAQPDRAGLGPIVLRARSRLPSPPHAELRRFPGHQGGTTAVQFVRNSTQIISGGKDNHLRIWNPSTEEELGALDVGLPVNAMGATSDGKLAVVAVNANDCDVWNLETKQRLGTLTGHSLSPRAVAVARGASIAATAGGDRTARVWNLTTRETLATFESPTALTAVAITPDGRFVVTGGQDGFLRIWDVERKRAGVALAAHEGAVTALVLSADGQTMASAGLDHLLCWWDLPRDIVE